MGSQLNTMRASAIVLLLVANLVNLCYANKSRITACHWRPADWVTWRPYQADFTSDNVPTEICDYLVFGVGRLDSNTWTLQVRDNNLDMNITNAVNLKRQNVKMKVQLSLGYWQVKEDLYVMAADPEKRKMFINSSVKFLTENNVDGLHLHWGSKEEGVTVDTSKSHLTTLLKELKEAFQEANLIITLSIWRVLKNALDTNFDIASVYKYADLVHLHAYGYHGTWEGLTGAMAPLYSSTEDGSINQQMNIAYSWNHLKARGALASKSVLVVASKGQGFVLKDPTKNGLYVPTELDGRIGWKYDHPLYNEICARIKSGEWTVKWDDMTKVPYMYKGVQWISYENMASVAEKVHFVSTESMAGLAVDNIGRDDVHGDCFGTEYPLLKTMQDPNITKMEREKEEERFATVNEESDAMVSSISSLTIVCIFFISLYM